MVLQYLMMIMMTVISLSTEIDGDVPSSIYTHSDDIEVKSKLSKSQNKVYIQISLPSGADVGFEIYDQYNRIQHLWHDQPLETGSHQLALPLPDLSKGKYLLHIKVGGELYKHLVLIS